MKILIEAIESMGFYDGECHMYIEICINEGNYTKEFLNESFEIAKFLNIDLKEYIERNKKFMAKLGYERYVFTSDDGDTQDDIEFLVNDGITKQNLKEIKEAFEEEFVSELTLCKIQ